MSDRAKEVEQFVLAHNGGVLLPMPVSKVCDLLLEWNALVAPKVPPLSSSPCTRCHKSAEQVFFINRSPPPKTWSETGFNVPSAPVYEASCGECLTDEEIAKMLAPLTLLALTVMLAKAPPASELLQALGRVRAEILYRLGPAMYPPDLRERAIRALQGGQAVLYAQNKVREAQSSRDHWKILAEGAQNDMLVPNEFRCTRCNYRLSMDGNGKAICPVDGSHMTRVTWKEAALTASRIASRARKRCETLEAAFPEGHAIPIGDEAEDKSIEEKIEFLQEKGLHDILFRNAGVGLLFFQPPEGFTYPEWTRGMSPTQQEDRERSWRKYLVVEKYYPSFDEAVGSEYLKRQTAAGL